MEYKPEAIEKKWQAYWNENELYKVSEDSSKEKFYVLDMFPYPSGAGLHVGHPLGYIASDIMSRFKRLKGFNVLHPMGFDSFGLPAEQYAIETGQHPAVTTEENISTFKKQMANIGFSFDWSRELRTSDPKFYAWTQWIFCRLFESWYDYQADKARPIEDLIVSFEENGTKGLQAAADEDTPAFTASEWNSFSDKEKEKIVLDYRLAFISDAMVNWCPALGTVLANDEVKDGVSERGGHPVERKKMRQWSLRITAYADRLLSDLDKLDWSDALKEMQRNWIGKSHGCELDFKAEGHDMTLQAFTTRPDTIFGVTYVAIAPEHPVVDLLTAEEHKTAVFEYRDYAKNRSERQRQADVGNPSGKFTGSYALNPISGEKVPIWVADYVLAGYGTGVVMGVPGSDDRDFRFAQTMGIEIKAVVEGTDIEKEAYTSKEGKMINSDFLNGLEIKDAIKAAIKEAEKRGVGRGVVNYRLRDAVFSRQRYWGEPVPVYFEDGLPKLVPDEELPLLLPEVNEYKPTAEGEPPLARAKDWKYKGQYPYEHTTMPGWAGSSWYFLRYLDADNDSAFVGAEQCKYWKQVDLYVGGTEHAVGHLLYSRFWTKFLFDRGFIPFDEPFKKLVNQGMIQGRSSLAYRLKDQNTFVSASLKGDFDCYPVHVHIKLVQSDVLDIEAFREWREDYRNAEFILEKEGKHEGKFLCEAVTEKMSKSKYNVVNPDDVIKEYGADSLRLYEMFLGPLEQSKPWNTEGIDGVFKFLRKLYRLFYKDGELAVTDEAPTKEELKVLHQTIQKIERDIESHSFNTCVSAFMVFTNEMTSAACRKRAVLEPFLILLSPFAPHAAEELWHATGNNSSILDAEFPAFREEYVKEDSHEYPVSINGKVRTKISFALDTPKDKIEQEVLGHEIVQKWTEGKEVKKFILVPKRIINVVVK